MTDTTTELAETIADIFHHMGWIWGLEQAGIPEHTPDIEQIADKIDTLSHELVTTNVQLVSDGRIVVTFDDRPRYMDHIRVLLDIGEIPLETT